MAPVVEARPVRRRLPQDCRSVRHKFDIAGHEGYIHVGLYDDGSPGELFIKIAKEGSTISGLMDTIGILTSMALQYGVPLDVLVSKFSHVRFEPSGFTKNPEIPLAKSLIDYIFRFLGAKFLSPDQHAAVGSALPDRQRTAERICALPRRQSTGGAERRLERGREPRLQPAVRCAELRRLRRDHDPQRQLLQMPELRCDERLLVSRDSRGRSFGERSGGAVVWWFPGRWWWGGGRWEPARGAFGRPAEVGIAPHLEPSIRRRPSGDQAPNEGLLEVGQQLGRVALIVHEVLDEDPVERGQNQRRIQRRVDVGAEAPALAAGLDDVGQQAAEDPVQVVDALGDVVRLALAADHEGEQKADRIDVVADEFVEEVDQPLDLRRFVEPFELVDVDEVRLEGAAEGGAEELLLAVEVPENQGLADLGLTRHLRQRRVFVAVSGEQACRGRQDAIAGLQGLIALLRRSFIAALPSDR